MAFTLGEIVTSIRTAHPAYADPQMVPARTLVDAAGDLQRRLAVMATQRYSGYLAQQLPIYLRLESANQPATVAAGTTGGLPSVNGSVTPDFATAGVAPFYDLSLAVTVLGDFVPTSVSVGVTDTVITLSTASRTIDADIGLGLILVQGPGAAPDAIRVVSDNTATTWTVPNYRQSPDTTTVIRLVQLPGITADGTSSAFVATPGVRDQAGYLVKIASDGTPYLDLTMPLVATLRQGVPLPPHDRLLGLAAVTKPSTWSGDADPITFPTVGQAGFLPVPLYHGQRSDIQGWGAWVEGNQLHLGGPSAAWVGIRNLVLRYVPIPPLFTVSRTVMDDAFLLPDTAYSVVLAGLTVTAAQQAAARGAQVPVQGAAQDYEAAKAEWLGSVGARGGAFLFVSGRNR